jgi:hypothetical protein
MTDDKILQMVSELVEFIDYDLWKRHVWCRKLDS